MAAAGAWTGCSAATRARACRTTTTICEPRLICLLGPAGSGKSTLAKGLQHSDPRRFARVPADYFFVPRAADVSVTAFLDQPLAYDWPTLDRALTRIGAERSSPNCDFPAWRRTSTTGGLPIAEAPELVLDGMRPHPRAEFVVLLEIDEASRSRRLHDRDLRWGTELAARTAHLDATYAQGRDELTRRPELIIDARDPIAHNVDLITAALG